jgi:hydrogenase/urease accessory protein HupE
MIIRPRIRDAVERRGRSDSGSNPMRILWLIPLLCVVQAPVLAHPLHLTTITVNIDETMTRVTAVVHVAHLPGARPESAIPARLRLRLDGVPFRPSETSAELDENGETITWRGREARPASVVAVDSPLFPDSASDSTIVMVYRDGHIVDKAVVDRESPGAILAETALAFSRRFVGMGIYHILSGLDHVLFVVGLLLVRGTFRGLLAVITAFTVAHSLTLSMTVLEIGSLPPWLVEPLIALSIVAVGAENLIGRTINLERRMWLAFGFGFFHGFGFAGALAQTGLPRDSIPWSLAAFNTGVEIGQACIVVVAVPILRMLQQQSAVFTAAVTRYASFGIAAAGMVWLVERLRF